MLGQQLVNSLDRFLKIIVQMAWLNFLWFLFTLKGLVVAGLFPATTATISVARKWIRDKMIHSTFQTFKETYKKEFKKSNLMGFFLTLTATILTLNYYILVELGDQIPVFVVFAYYFVIFLFTVQLVWVFPLLCHYETNIIKYFKSALIIGITKILTTVFIIIIIFLIIYISLELPSLFLFFSISLIAITVAYSTGKVFEELDNKNSG